MTSIVRFGLLVALLTLVADQASKLYLFYVFDLGARGAVRVTPFFDLVLVWNRGISYGLFQLETAAGQMMLLGFKVLAVIALGLWLWRADSRLTALGLGLIIGGAIGNAIDNLAYHAVMDFAHFHLTWSGKSWSWYVFNIADAAIVAGVIGLLYDSVFPAAAAKAP